MINLLVYFLYCRLSNAYMHSYSYSLLVVWVPIIFAMTPSDPKIPSADSRTTN